MTPEEYSNLVIERTGQPPQRRFGQPRTTEERTARHKSLYGTTSIPERKWSFRNFMRGVSNIMPRSQPTNINFQTQRQKPVLSPEEVRQRIINDNNFTCRQMPKISLMGTDREHQIQNQMLDRQMPQSEQINNFNRPSTNKSSILSARAFNRSGVVGL